LGFWRPIFFFKEKEKIANTIAVTATTVNAYPESLLSPDF
jgi:hypothetical protein